MQHYWQRTPVSGLKDTASHYRSPKKSVVSECNSTMMEEEWCFIILQIIMCAHALGQCFSWLSVFKATVSMQSSWPICGLPAQLFNAWEYTRTCHRCTSTSCTSWLSATSKEEQLQCHLNYTINGTKYNVTHKAQQESLMEAI